MRLPERDTPKPSTEAFYGGLPIGWTERRLRYLCQIIPSNVDKHSRDDELPVELCNYTDVYYNDRITLGIQFMEATATPEQIARFGLQAGDTVITKDSETADDIGIPAFVPDTLPGVVCGYHLTILRPGADVEGRFIHWLFQTAPLRSRLETLATGLTRVGLSQQALKDLVVPLPSLDEQRRIAAFLDHETARIDELVREQERLGTMLLERRSALVVAAVSGQLSSAKMVDSRIPWLSKIAYGWQEVQIRRVAKLGTGHTPSRSRPDYWEDCTIPWVTTGEVVQLRQDHIEYLYETREKISEVGLANSSAVLHPAGTVFLSRTASAGFSGIMGLPMATSQDYVTWTCGEKLNPRFLLLCLRAMRSDLLGRLAMGSTHKTIYMPEVEQLMIPLPPLAEQTRLVELAWNELSQIDSALELLTQRSELLRERRSALISAAVTGQLDLRSWQLPELETIAEVA